MVTNNVVSAPITLSEVASFLKVSNSLKAVCTTVTLNKFSAVKPVDLNILSGNTYEKISNINFGLIASAISTSVDRKISAVPTYVSWTYQRPQGGSTSPYRLGDFCVVNSSSDTSRRGYKHNAQVFLESKACDLDVDAGQNTVLPLQFLMDGKRLEFTAGSGANIDIDLKDLSLDYKSTSDSGAIITQANRRITCGYWRVGLLVIVPLYQQTNGYDVANGVGAYICCAKDVVSTAMVANILTQSVRFNYGCANALLMMKRAMIYDSSNTYFEALPILVFNSSYNSISGSWSSPDKILTFPNTGYIRLNMTNMISCKMVVSSQTLTVNGSTVQYTPTGFVCAKTTLTSASSAKSVVTLTVGKPAGDSWSNGRVTIMNNSCTFTSSTSGVKITLTITWSSSAVSALKSSASSAPVGATIAIIGQIRYLSSIKGADVYTDLTIPIRLL